MQHARRKIVEEGIANENVFGVEATGLSVANSLKEVQKRAADDIAGLPNRVFDGDDFLSRHKIDALTDTEQTVIYSTISTFDRYGRTEQIGYDSFTIAFYDFQLHVLSNEDQLSGEITTNTTTAEDGLITITENYDYSDITDSATLTNSVTETLSSTISNSESYTFGEAIGGSISWTQKFPGVGTLEVGGNLNFSFGQAMETAYSETNELSKTVDKSSTVTKTVPAHTKEMGQQIIANTRVVTSYDCPVGLTYKVAIFSMCGTCYDDNLATQAWNTAGYEQRSFITIFGADASAPDAVESLYQRATNHKNDTSYDQTYGHTKGTNDEGSVWCTGLNWNTIISQGKPSSKSASGLKGGTDLIYALDDTYPMSISGGTTSVTQQSITTIQGTPEPILPIASVYINWQLDRSFEMVAGDALTISSYRVKAADRDAVPYYGFVPTWGEWRIVDADGVETSSEVAEIVKDSVTGEQRILAKSPGTIYVKYFIPEDTYYTYDGVASTNANIESAAYRVDVSAPPEEEAPPFEGSIVLEGDVVTTVGETINLNAEEGLTVTAYDSTGREVAADILWQAQELETKGISVTEEGVLTTTQAGTFHVRAYCGDVYSDWVEVVAEEPEELVQHACGHAYTDVDHDQWYDEAVEYVNQNDLMNGTGEGLFDPNGQVDRATVVQVLHRLAGSPDAEGLTNFEDVDKDAWYAKAVAWAAEQGITTGRTETSFAPLEDVTREEAAVLIVRYLDSAGLLNPVQGSYVDIGVIPDGDEVSDWAREELEKALQEAILTGRADGTLDPQGTTTRAELAQILMNLEN